MSVRSSKRYSALNAELEVVSRKVSLQETEDTWDTIQQGIVQLTECCNGGGGGGQCDLETEMVAAIRSLSGSLNRAMNSERSRLSGSAIKLITALSARLGPAFEPLIPLFIRTLLGLCTRANKLFVVRAKMCIIAIIENTRSRSILSYLVGSVDHKSQSLRLAAVEGALACLNSFTPADRARARRFEDVIKLAAQDASACVRTAGKKLSEAYKAMFPESVTRSVPVTSVVQKTREPTRTIVTSTRQGAQDAPSVLGSRSIPSRDQKRDALPSIPTTLRPKQVSTQQGGLGGSLKVPVPKIPVPAARLPETNNAEGARTVRPPSGKPNSVLESRIPRYTQKNNLVSTKVQSAGSNYPSTIRPSSQNDLRPSMKAFHLTTGGADPQIGQLRARAPASKEVEKQKVSSLTSSGRIVASGGQYVTKAPASRLYLGTKNPGVPKPAQDPEDVFSVVASPAQPTPANTHYSLPAPRTSAHPPRPGCHIRQPPFQPRRHIAPCTKTPSEVFVTSTPLRGSFLLALSPPHIHGAKPIPHTHAPDSPRILCPQGCGLRPVTDRVDPQPDLASMRRDPCTKTAASTLRLVMIKSPPRDFYTSTPCASFSVPLSPPHIYEAKPVPHTHGPSNPRTSCFQGCGLRGILKGQH